jgi:hypothetical protein
MSIEKLLKTLAVSINPRQEMRDSEDMPVKMCWCCQMPASATDLFYYADNQNKCYFALSGKPVQKRCEECHYLGDDWKKKGPTYVNKQM